MIDNLIEKIRAFAARPDVPINMLAKEAGLHVNSVHRLNDSNWNPKANTLRALDEAITRLSDVTVNVAPPRAAK